MQAVILAAGKGTRMGALTESVPKPLLEVAGKTLLEHALEVLPESIDEVIIVVGYMGGSIQKHLGGEYKSKRLLYVEQENLDGTAGALWRARSVLHDQFLVMDSDNIYRKDDVIKCISKADGWTMLVQNLAHMKAGGRIITDKKGSITSIEEGEHQGKPGLINASMYVFDTRIFDCPLVPKVSGNNEFGLPQTALAGSRQLKIPFHAIPATFWLQITTPEDLQKAREMLGKTSTQAGV